MITRFVCLANSYKEGGRCLAGIELDKNYSPIIVNNKPKWIRPVTADEHGIIPTIIAESFEILNIIEIDITGDKPEGYQSENVTFLEVTIKIIRNYDKGDVANLCDNRDIIFGNKGKAVSQDVIQGLNHSLMFVCVTQFEIIVKEYEDRPDKPQIRLLFLYNGNSYDLPITDPDFLHRFQNNEKILDGKKQIFLSLSLGIVWKGWYYKLIAGLIY
jgi:hypothetical protein